MMAVGRVPEVPLLELLSLLERRISSACLRDAVESIYSHRVIPQAINSLSRIKAVHGIRSHANAIELLGMLTPLEEALLLRSQSHSEALAELTATNLPLVGIKGVHLERFYTTTRRQSSDIDIGVDSEHSWRSVKTLLDLGYRVKKLRLDLSTPVSNNQVKLRGVCEASRRKPGSPGTYIDVHIGVFPACGDGCVAFSASELDSASLLTTPNRQLSLLIHLAHIVRQGMCRFRDLNDLWLLLGDSDPGELKHLVSHSKTEHYEYLLISLIRLLEGLYPRREAIHQITQGQKPRFLDFMLLFEKRINRDNMLDDCTFLLSRHFQIRYLHSLNSSNYGSAVATLRTVSQVRHLLGNGRPYSISDRNTLGPISNVTHLVLLPLASFAVPDNLQHQLYSLGYNVDEISETGLAVVKRAGDPELIVGPGLVFARCKYDGDIENVADYTDATFNLLTSLGIQDARVLDGR